MLPLDHPLWRKLDDAHRDRDIPQLLAKLSEAWDDDSGTRCRLGHQFALLGGQVALYAEERSSLPAAGIDQRPLLDMKEGTASRSDGIMTPVNDNRKLVPLIERLIRLADRAQGPAGRRASA